MSRTPASLVRGPIRLGRVSPDPPRGVTHEATKKLTARYEEELAELDDLHYFAREHSVLIVLQGPDTSGKDGTIRKILDCSNAQGVRVESFKAPTEHELAHDFLWRVHAKTPARGEVVLFNRSHYEDVLVPRVHKLVNGPVVNARYRAINDFEHLLVANRTIVLKFFLHVSRDEQKRRLLERERDAEKAWKLAVRDWQEREHWDEYSRAYETLLTKCSPRSAPWHVVPANEKWYRNYLVLKTIVETLRPYRKGWLTSLAALGTRRAAELRAFRAGR
jgi:PPK2 family polyphosphate:nucleotide phosphotransferase